MAAVFQLGVMGLFPLLLLLLTAKVLAGNASMPRNGSPGFGLSIYAVGDCFSLSPPFFCFISHLVSCSVLPNTFRSGLQSFEKAWSLSPTRTLLRRKNNSSHVALRLQICGEKSGQKKSQMRTLELDFIYFKYVCPAAFI